MDLDADQFQFPANAPAWRRVYEEGEKTGGLKVCHLQMDGLAFQFWKNAKESLSVQFAIHYLYFKVLCYNEIMFACLS